MHIAQRFSSSGGVLLACLALGAACSTAVAQSQRSGSNANAQLMQQMQQLASERTALQAENARMKKELAEVSKERDTLKNGRQALDRRAQASEAALARSAQEKVDAESETQKLKDRMQEIVVKYRELAQTLKEVETERTAFKDSLTARDAELKQCAARNDALYKLNGEILTRMEGTGPMSRLASLEPFTKLKRVQLENLIDEYRYRAEDQKIGSVLPAAQPK